MKKSVTIMLACIMAFSAVTCFAADGKQYYDYGTYVLLGDSVAGGHNDLVYVDSEYYSDVEFMYTHGYMNGLTDMEFGPDEAFTKAALAQALYNIAGTPEVDTGNVAFSDIDSSDPTFNAAAWATSNGVLSAKNGKFAPDSGITVFNFVLILVKLSYAGNFVLAKVIKTMVLTFNIIKDFGFASFNTTLTRAQAAHLLVDYCGI